MGRRQAPYGVVFRQTEEPEDFRRIQELVETARAGDGSWIPPALAEWTADRADPTVVLVAETRAHQVVAAPWVRFHTGTGFASLWGSSTLPSWRGLGLYQLLTTRRAQLAVDHGFPYLYVEALPSSSPILAKLGFAAARTQHLYRFTPGGSGTR
jgi:hypothetical protein